VGGSGLLGDYPDLMEIFNEFLLQAEKNGNIQTSDYFL
jgi:histone deacetylase complex regulatory component SIN3